MTHRERQLKKGIVAGIYGVIGMGIFAAIAFLVIPGESPEQPSTTPDITPLQVERSRILSLSENTKDIVAEVKNSNDRYGLQRFQYKFILQKGEEERVFTGQTYILPGETRFVMKLNASLETGYTLEDVQITPQSEWKQLEVEPPTLVIQKREQGVLENDGRYQIRGEVVNRSPYDLRSVMVSAVLEDDQNNIIGVNRTQVDILQTEEIRAFNIRWPESVSFESVEKTRIRPSTNALDSDTILYIPEGELERFQ